MNLYARNKQLGTFISYEKYSVLNIAQKRRRELFPDETIPNVKIPNPKNGENPKRKNPKKGLSPSPSFTAE
jgi:hypothetical protein